MQIPSGNDWLSCSKGLAGFVVVYNEVNAPDKETQNVASNARSATVQSLNSCSRYEFTVRARNKDTDGIDSPIEEVLTKNGGNIFKWDCVVCSVCILYYVFIGEQYTKYLKKWIVAKKSDKPSVILCHFLRYSFYNIQGVSKRSEQLEKYL